jgi:hypothetical protein
MKMNFTEKKKVFFLNNKVPGVWQQQSGYDLNKLNEYFLLVFLQAARCEHISVLFTNVTII